MAATAKLNPQAAFDYQIFMASYLLSMAASFYYCERNRVKPPEGAPSAAPGATPAAAPNVAPQAPKMPNVHAAPLKGRDLSDEP